MTRYKTLTPDVVRDAAEALMLTNGTTTTLEVKNRLRNAGFWAVQSTVSAYMREIATYRGWQVVAEQRFRIYALPAQASFAETGYHLLFLN